MVFICAYIIELLVVVQYNHVFFLVQNEWHIYLFNMMDFMRV